MLGGCRISSINSPWKFPYNLVLVWSTLCHWLFSKFAQAVLCIYIYIRSTTKQGFQSPTPQKQEEPEVLLGQNVLATTLLFPNFAGKKKLLEVNWQLAGMAGPMYFPIVMVVYQRVEITNWSTISLPQLVGTRVVYQIRCFNQQHCSELKTLWTCSRLLQNASTSLFTWL